MGALWLHRRQSRLKIHEGLHLGRVGLFQLPVRRPGSRGGSGTGTRIGARAKNSSARDNMAASMTSDLFFPASRAA